MHTVRSHQTAPSPSVRRQLAPMSLRTLLGAAFAGALALGVAMPTSARAQWVTTYEQFYLQAPHNWVFRNNYQAADRLFNAFDYGHAILYEKLWTQPSAPASLLEEKEYDFLTKRVLVRPPRVPLEEAAIEIKYVQLAPEAKQMFEWAHILHRQLYDVIADERLSQAEKDAEVQRVIAYYKTRPDITFSSRPKSMKLMQEQPYSLAFRQQYPKFNGLIWGYHWLQVGLYEPLMVGRTPAERQAGVRATVARFWQMLQDPPRTFPHQMPMTPAIAPTFSARYPEAAIIFDNLHSMHDVISDILANDSVPRNRKRAEIQLAARRFRDDTSFVMTREAWLTMAQHMGVENMGGPAVAFLPTLPTPTVTYGAVISHDDRTGEMTGFKYGQATGGAHAGHTASSGTPATRGTNAANAPAANAHAGHGATPPATAAGSAAQGVARPPNAAMDHAAMGHTAAGKSAAGTAAASASMIEMHMRMMADPVIRQRVLADTATHRLMMEAVQAMPAEHREHMQSLMHGGASGSAAADPVRKEGAASTNRPAARRAAPAARPAPRPAAPAADPHAGHGTTPAARPAAKPPAKAAPARTPTRPTKARPATRDSMAGMDHTKHRMPPRHP